MKLSPKQISIIIVVAFALYSVGLGLAQYLLSTHRQPTVTNAADHSSTPVVVDSEPILDVPPLPVGRITTDPYLASASAILQKITSKADEYGFYGVAQICPPESNDDACRLGDRSANWREGLAVIWGRYQYYLATGDQQQRELLTQDVDNLVTKIIDGGYLLRSRSFNCLWMAPLIDSPYLPVKTKQQAARICLESPFEYAPNSSVAFDQHRHDSEEQINTYQPEELITHISQNLQRVAQGGGDITSFTYLNQIEQLDFFTREAAAALDQLVAMKIAKQKDDPAAYDAALIHYLLLTDELMMWYHSHETSIRPEDKCLLATNLEYFIQTFKPTLSSLEKMILTNLYTVDNPGVMCSFARSALLGKPLSKSYFAKYLLDVNPPGWAGSDLMLASNDGQWLYPTELNAVLAGIFSWEERTP